MTEEPPRPDPDALLAQLTADAAAARRGKLKIFFGAAPGVGKTYAMLGAARDARANGVDVVVGLAETHGRAETEALLAGLEVLARRRVDYRERTLAEFDLDAALARRPALLLVDELAHSNAPGSRHPKRWQDVEELLAAGIDVWTTLNVQHLESLNDVVGGITGVRVWETVADRVFDAADEVALVDLPPDDLLTRLKEGKVYLPAQAAMAVENFFRRANLIALRDLSLRRLAERVDAQVQTARAAAPGARVWATAESLLVCLGPGDTDGKLIRSAARLASKLDARWHAVYIETPRLQRLPEDRRSAILATLRLAQEMGAETAVLAEPDLVDAALDYARAHNLGKIVIGRRARPQRRWWGQFMRRLGERAPDIDLIAVARRAEWPPAPRQTAPPPSAPAGRVAPYAGAAALCVAVALLATPLRYALELSNIVMLFLLAVVGAAYRWGRGPAVLAAVLSVALFDFFFVPPRFTFAVSDMQYLVTFAVMLIVGLTIGQSMVAVRYQARIAGHREQRIQSLYRMARDLSAALGEAQVAEIGARSLVATFHAQVRVLLPDTQGKLAAPVEAMPQVDLAIAQWCFDHGEPAGIGTDTLPAAAAAYLPLRAPAGMQGVLAVQPDNRRLLHIPEQRRLLETHATLIAMALERLHFVTQVHETRLGAASERLRSSLLAALSHDLRTPLTALVGLADTLTLRLLAAQAPEHETAAAIRDQALRTGHMVDNLLEMARLQSGTVTPRHDWLVLEEVVGAAVRALEPALAGHPLETELPADLPLVQGDAVMLERVLVNLLDNAIKYTPPGTPIGITAAVAGETLEVAVWDAGPGLPPGQEQLLFERFARGTHESAITGVGLRARHLPGHHRRTWRAHPRRKSPRGRGALRLHPAARAAAGAARGDRAIDAAALIVEDDAAIRLFVRRTLEDAGLKVAEAATLARGLIEAGTRRPDLVILDLGLPDGDGRDFITALRAWSRVPVIVLSARIEEADKVAALDAGADDYLTKPFGVAELLARVRVALRHGRSGVEAGSVVHLGPVTVDLVARRVQRGGADIHLTAVEFRLLTVLLKAPGRVLTHRHLLREVWGPNSSEHSHYLRIYMARLRHKLEADPARPRYLVTETGVGYRCVPDLPAAG